MPPEDHGRDPAVNSMRGMSMVCGHIALAAREIAATSKRAALPTTEPVGQSAKPRREAASRTQSRPPNATSATKTVPVCMSGRNTTVSR